MGGSGSRAQCRYRAEEQARGRLCNPCMDTSRSWRTGRQTRAEVVCKVGGVFVPVVAVSAPLTSDMLHKSCIPRVEVWVSEGGEGDGGDGTCLLSHSYLVPGTLFFLCVCSILF